MPAASPNGNSRNAWLWAAGIFLLVGIGFLVISFRAGPAASRIQASVQAEERKSHALEANASVIAMAMTNFERMRSGLDRRHLQILSERDRTAAEQGARLAALTKTLQLKAVDKVKGDGDRAGDDLRERLGSMVDPVRQDYVNDVAAALTRMEVDIDKSTAALAHELATAAPVWRDSGISLPKTAAFDTEVPATAQLGITLAFGTLDAAIVSRIVGKVFLKQIGRLAAVPALMLIDGPMVMGDVVALAFAGWTWWDIHHLRSKYEGELSSQLTTSRTAFMDAVDAWAKQQATAIRRRGVAARDEVVRELHPT